jgi:ABC-type glycerol-3-phosphate transport system permease component
MTAPSVATTRDRAAEVPVGSNKAWSRLVILLVFLVLAVVFLIPLYWMVVSSLRPQDALFTDLTDLTPTDLTLDNYARLFQEQPYGQWFINSIAQSLGFAALTVAVCTMAGYALAKYRFRGNNVLFFGILISQMIPFNLLIVSLFFIIIQLGLKETYWGAIIPLAASPIGLFFMRVYCISLNEEMMDSARVDGANEYRIFWSIALPNLRPGLATLFILFALEYWNNLLWPLIVFLKEQNFPLAVGIASMVNSYRTQYDLVLAGSTLATVPIIILFFFLRRQFMEGSSFTGTGVQ